MPAPPETDAGHMRAALALARRHLGLTWPNPSVGCVIVDARGRVVGRGATAPGGRPHAEAVALAMAGGSARGGTAYVTLEPCSHHGRAAPCAPALAGAGLARVVAATGDPDPRVNGAGFALLRAAGIAVEYGLLAAEADSVMAGFLMRVRRGRPFVTLKLAGTLDGRIATRSGESRWITGDVARRRAHALRAEHDAILVGAGTVLADDPDLGCRLPGAERDPVRVVALGASHIPPSARVLSGAPRRPGWFAHAPDADPAQLAALRSVDAELLPVADGPNGIDPGALLAALGRKGLTTVLAEGGARLAASLLRARLVDRLAWLHAPAVMGDGLPAVAPLGADTLAAMPRFRLASYAAIGGDTMAVYEPVVSV